VSDSNELREEFTDLRDRVCSVQIATLSSAGLPEVSYAPFIWAENSCFLFLSDLAQHTSNIRGAASISVMAIEDERDSRSPFARRRIILQGKAVELARNNPLFKPVLSSFRNRFGDIMDLIEPLQDFNLFQITPTSGRFIKGFGQAFELAGENLQQLVHINPGKNK
jgi:putative heme iron utilization protein